MERKPPDIPIWVAVVSVDSSRRLDKRLGDIHDYPVDENSLDPGAHLPEVGEIMAYWDSSVQELKLFDSIR